MSKEETPQDLGPGVYRIRHDGQKVDIVKHNSGDLLIIIAKGPEKG